VPAADWLAHHDTGRAGGQLHETALDNARGRLLTLGAGLLAAGALWFTARTFTLSREGHVTDRYAKAIEQLGSDKLDVRIGGIYALERIARDSARDHPVVMEVLTAFIREHSYEKWSPPARPGLAWIARLERSWIGGRYTEVRPDIQAAFTVIGRRDAERDAVRIDLFGANLHFAKLRDANLERAVLTDADLRFAILPGARLGKAVFLGADLADAHLDGADLRGANLRGADLKGADLTGVDLSDADLDGVRWPNGAPVPAGWKRAARSGRLRQAGTNPRAAEAD
jgi:hypothetical protein